MSAAGSPIVVPAAAGRVRDMGLLRRRRAADALVTALCFAATLVVLAALASILWTLVAKGVGGLTLHVLGHFCSDSG